MDAGNFNWNVDLLGTGIFPYKCLFDHGWEYNVQVLVLYPDPDSHSCGWITSPLPKLWESGSGYETISL